MGRIEEEIHKKYRYLEIINGIVFNPPGYQERCLIQEIHEELKQSGEEVPAHIALSLQKMQQKPEQEEGDQDDEGDADEESVKSPPRQKKERADPGEDFISKLQDFLDQNDTTLKDLRVRFDTILDCPTGLWSNEEMAKMKADTFLTMQEEGLIPKQRADGTQSERGSPSKSLNSSRREDALSSTPNLRNTEERLLATDEPKEMTGSALLKGYADLVGTGGLAAALAKERTLREVKFMKGKPLDGRRTPKTIHSALDKMPEASGMTAPFPRRTLTRLSGANERLGGMSGMMETTEEAKVSLPRIGVKDPRLKLPVIKSAAAREKASSMPRAPLPKPPGSSHDQSTGNSGIKPAGGRLKAPGLNATMGVSNSLSVKSGKVIDVAQTLMNGKPGDENFF